MGDTVLTTTARVDHPINIFHQKKLLTRVMPALIHSMFMQHDKMPQHEGEVSKWRRFSNLSAATAPLTEGRDPAPVQPSKTDLSAIVKEYGALINISSWLKMTGLSRDENEMSNILLDNMAETLDLLAQYALVTCASTLTCSNGSPTTTYLNKTDIDTVVKNLLGQNAKRVAAQINAGSGVGTAPVAEAFIGLCHTDQYQRLQNVAGFRPTSTYPNGQGVYKDELGATGAVRWIASSNGYSSGGYYYNIIMAKDAAGDCMINGPSANGPLKYTSPEQVGGLQRYGQLGWLRNYVATILNHNFMYILKST